MSSITYHFGGKIGLFRAAANCVEKRIAFGIEGSLARAEDVIAESDRNSARQALHEVIARIVELMFSPQTSAFARFVAQEQFVPASDWHDDHGKVISLVLVKLSQLLRCIAGSQMSDEEALMRSTALYGHILAFRFVGRDGFPPADRPSSEISMIKHIIAEDLDGICDRLEKRRPE